MRSQEGLKERRAYVRFPVDIPLQCYSYNSDDVIKAWTHDLSKEGLSILTDKKIIPGILLDMCIRMLDNEEKIFIKGKVVWRKNNGFDRYRVGIQLEESNLNPVPLVLRAIMASKKI